MMMIKMTLIRRIEAMKYPLISYKEVNLPKLRGSLDKGKKYNSQVEREGIL